MGYTLRLLASFILVFIIILEVSSMAGYLDKFSASAFIHENIYHPLAYTTIVYADRVTTPRVDYTPTQTEEPAPRVDNTPTQTEEPAPRVDNTPTQTEEPKSRVSDNPVTPETVFDDTVVPSTEPKPIVANNDPPPSKPVTANRNIPPYTPTLGYNNNNNNNPTPIVPDTGKIFRYTLETLDHNEAELIKSAVYQAFQSWQNPNKDISFIRGGYIGADLVVRFEGSHAAHAGIYNGDGEITISLGIQDCNGNYILYPKERIQTTAAHEIGHFLGLGHSKSEDHLMYGNTSTNEDYDVPFDRYIIPEPASTDREPVLFPGQAGIEEKLEALDKKLEVWKGKANPTDYNFLVHQYNNLVEEYNCYYDTTPFYFDSDYGY